MIPQNEFEALLLVRERVEASERQQVWPEAAAESNVTRSRRTLNAFVAALAGSIEASGRLPASDVP